MEIWNASEIHLNKMFTHTTDTNYSVNNVGKGLHLKATSKIYRDQCEKFSRKPEMYEP